jgi:hypothetical protein
MPREEIDGYCGKHPGTVGFIVEEGALVTIGRSPGLRVR